MQYLALDLANQPLRNGIYGQIDTFRQTVRFSSTEGKNPSSSAADNNDETDDDNEGADEEPNNDEKDDQEYQKTIHFPWRHESTPTARILENDDLSCMPNNFRARFIRRLVASKELNLPALQAIPLPFYTHEWETELAINFQTAFGFALEELLSSVFRGRVPVKNDDGGISIDTSMMNVVNNKEDDEDNNPLSKRDDANDDDTDNLLENNSYLKSMFDKKLLAKYQSINPDNLQLKLSVQPIESTLQSIFAVPLVTRAIVEKKPHLKGSYQRIETAFAERKSYDEVKKMTYDLAAEIGEDDAYNRTVIADALITCTEFFQLRDASSGELIHGMEDGSEPEEIVHNVRFEVITQKDEEDRTMRKVGSWKIVDLDDMLEGNIFY